LFDATSPHHSERMRNNINAVAIYKSLKSTFNGLMPPLRGNPSEFLDETWGYRMVKIALS